MRTLIAEDDSAIAAAIRSALEAAGHAVDVVGDGAAADQALASGAFELLVLDLGLPFLEGTEVLKRLRRRGSAVPVLVITARDAVRERVGLLDMGADDYLVKPFELSEFEARIRALIRRSANRGASELPIGNLLLDLAGQKVTLAGEVLPLTKREFELLAALAARPGKVTSRAQLVDALCNWDSELTDNGMDIAIHRLRRRLEGTGVGVRTIRGLGYRLEEESHD